DSALLRTVAIRMAMAVENARLFRRARRAEEILQDMSSGIEQVLYVSSIDPFRIEMVNPAFERMFGRRPEELYADPSSLIESIHPEDRGLVRAALGRQAEGESTETDYRILRPDGRLRWVRDRAFPRRAHDGKVYRVVGVVEDVTERKRREEELAFLADAGEVLSGSLNYVETLQNVASLAVPQIATWCAVDLLLPDGGLDRVAVAHIDPEKIRWARELQERYPVDMEAPQGVPQVLRSGQPELYSIIPEEMLVQAAVDEEHLQAILSAEIRSAMVAPLGIHGQVYGAISFVSDELGRYDEQSLELAVELARRAGQAVENARIHSSVEHMVEERTTELKALNRELEAFTYSVSHDLRAPLRAIVANARMLAEDFGEELPPQAHEFLKNQEDAAKRLALLIDELLQLSRLRKLEIVRSDFDFTALCHEVIREILSPEKAERVRIVVEDGRRANGDPRLVRIVIQNLLENAIKFSPEGGEIRVGSKAGAFFVQDQGIGFDMQFADKLFLPFERLVADHEFEGTGIGLASVQRVVQRHGGRVWAESTPGQGSTFFFTLE
ncbi:MAG TPA: ATP-binding protein, partial [Fimbriimonadaceae bacterium]|nr:ATP-binding protein [Fimbriimonadaceae bacterium]